MKRVVKKIQKAMGPRFRAKSLFHELWEERKELYTKEQKGSKADRVSNAMLVRARTKLTDSLNRVLLLRYIFDSMPGETFEEKKKAYEKFKESSRIFEFDEKTGEMKGKWFGLPHFIGIRTRKSKNSNLKKFERLAGISSLDKRTLNELKEVVKSGEVENIDKEAKNVLSKLEALNVVKLKRKQNKIIGVEVIDSKAYEKMLSSRRVPWPELPVLKKKEE